MTDRVDDVMELEVPEIPEDLEKIMVMALEEGRAKMEAGELLVPFTAVVVKESLFIESHPGDDADECFEAAIRNLEAAKGASAYAFCYDGFVDGDEGEIDCIIAEGGLPGQEESFVIGYVYEADEDDNLVSLDDEPVFIDMGDNYMAALKPASEYSDAEIPERYLSREGFDAE